DRVHAVLGQRSRELAQQVVARRGGVARQVGGVAVAQADRVVAIAGNRAGVDHDAGRVAALQVHASGIRLGRGMDRRGQALYHFDVVLQVTHVRFLEWDEGKPRRSGLYVAQASNLRNFTASKFTAPPPVRFVL